MARSSERSGFFKSPWATIARLGFTAIFFFWLYLIWSSTAGLNESLDATEDSLADIHHVQVEFKDEIQDWQDLLLRSNNEETLDQNWKTYEAQYQKVVAEANKIMAKTDVREIHQKMKSFVDAHAINHEKYKDSLPLLTKNNFNPKQADTAVKNIDEPILEYLAVTEIDMRDEKRRINESLISKARSQIEQSLFALAFIGLLAIWIQKH